MTVTTYASPGLESLRSQKYTVTAAAVGAAPSAPLFVYSQAYATEGENEIWDTGQQVQVDWITIGSDENVDARINLIDGPIFDAQVYPRDVGVTQTIVDGQLRLTVPSNRRLRIEINGDRRSPLHLFVSLPEAPLPGGSVAYVAQTSVADGAALHFPSGGVYVVAPGLLLGNNCTVTVQGGAVVIFADPDLQGTAASATASSLTVSGTPWTAGAFNGLEVRISGGVGVGQVRTITTNTNNTLNVSPNWATNPTSGSTFTILASKRAGFDLSALNPTTNVTGVTIQGHGVVTSLAARFSATVATLFASQIRYCPIATDSVSVSPVNCRVIGPTFVRWPFYLMYGGAHYLRNVQWLNPWTFNSDGFQPGRKTASDSAALVCDSFGYSADDGAKVFVSAHRITIRNTFLVQAQANAFQLGFFGNGINDSSGGAIIDCDAMSLTDADSLYPVQGSQCIVAGFVDGSDSGPTVAYFNVSITGLRVWGPIYSRLFAFRNLAYPYGGIAPQDAAGQFYHIAFDDVVTEYVPGQPSLLLGRDAVNTPHDLTFTDVVIGGTKLDAGNFQEFVEVNAYPYALTWDAPGLIVETGTGSADATSYCSLTFADDYHAAQGDPAAWSGASAATKEAAIRQATRALDARYGELWAGFRKTSAQALDWPREYASDSAGASIPSTTIPLRLQQAAALMALYHVQGETIMPATTVGGDVKSETLSSASGSSKSVVYIGGRTVDKAFPLVDALLLTGGIVTSGTGGGWGWLDL